MKVVEKDGEITLRDIPATNWTQGVLLLFGSIFFAAPVVLNSPSKNSFDFWLVGSFLLAIFSLYFAYTKISAPIIVTRISAAEQIVAVTQTKFALIKTTETYRFAEISHFEMVKRRPERAYLYFNAMILRNDSCIDLEATGFATQTNRISSKLNEFLKKHRTIRSSRKMRQKH